MSEQSAVDRAGALPGQRARGLGALVCAAALAHGALHPALARAQAADGPAPAGATGTEEATRWFHEGRRQLDQQHPAAAAQAFEKSLALAYSASTLLNLGNAYRLAGDRARALHDFERALAAAHDMPDEARRQALVEAAQQQIDALKPEVATLVVTPPSTPGAVLRINGQSLGSGAVSLRLNPGRYQLEAAAPDHTPYSEVLRLTAGQRVDRVIPALVAVAAVNAPVQLKPEAPLPSQTPLPSQAPLPNEAAPPSEVPPAVAEASAGPRFGPWPWVLAGAGVGLAGAAVFTGLGARSKADNVKEACPTLTRCDRGLVDDYDGAQDLALATDVLWIVGGTALAAGVTLLVIRAQTPESTAIEASCALTGCSLRGQF